MAVAPEEVKVATPPLSKSAEVSKTFDMDGLFTPHQKAWFANIAKIVYKDLNSSTKSTTFAKYSKEQITTYVQNPETNEEQLRNAVVMLYNLSSHFHRLVHYFADLCDMAYIISQVSFEDEGDTESIKDKYRRTAIFLAGSDIPAQCKKILTTCFREDVCYVTTWVTKDGMAFQILDPKYCKIASQSQNCFNVSFDFSYFDQYSDELPLFPAEFTTKYHQYQQDTTTRWIELDVPNSFAIKVNTEFLYPLPPFAGILREIYDIEDYKALQMVRSSLDNYCLIAMKLGLNNQGEWALDFDTAKQFWQNLESILPENVGSVLSPMQLDKISFDQSGTADNDKVAASEKYLWDAAGVSSLIFSGSSTSSRALEISGMADESLTWSVVRNIGIAINRILQKQSFGKNFRLVFLPCGRYTRDSYQKTLMSTIQYGLPVTPLMATLGMEPLYALGLNHLETQVLDLPNRLVPLQSGNTLSSNDPGRPASDDGNITDEGLRTRDKQ